MNKTHNYVPPKKNPDFNYPTTYGRISEEQALRSLQPLYTPETNPYLTWGTRGRKFSRTRNPSLFCTVPPHRQHLAHKKLAEWMDKWMRENPGQTMPSWKRACYIGLAARFAIYYKKRHFYERRRQMAMARRKGRWILEQRAIAEFKERNKGMVRHLPLG